MPIPYQCGENLYPLHLIIPTLGELSAMRSPRGNRYPPETVAEGISSLSSALTRLQGLAGMDKTAMARKIGFTMGVEVGSRGNPTGYADIHSELSSLFRRLNLGKVVLREWEPVVFVIYPESKAESLEVAFGQGILEGFVHARSRQRVFVRHSIPVERRGKSRSVKRE